MVASEGVAPTEPNESAMTMTPTHSERPSLQRQVYARQRFAQDSSVNYAMSLDKLSVIVIVNLEVMKT